MSGCLVYYVSSHGYGHGARSTDILRALVAAKPDLPITVTTDLPPAFLHSRLPHAANITLRAGAYDVGMVQLDSIRVDLAATFSKVRDLYMRRAELVRDEADFLRSVRARMIVSDIAAIPVEAAKLVGLPALAVSNFAWDWIYSDFVASDPAWAELIPQFSEGYAQTDLLLRLPFAEEMRSFPRKEDIGLLAKQGREQRRELARLTGADLEKKWVLLSFTSLEWDEKALAKVAKLNQYEFFSVLPLAWPGSCVRAIDRQRINFADVVASVDVVVSKPGFGLVSECIVNRKPLIYADRTHFAEYPILVEGIKAYLSNAHIPQGKLYRGDLAEALASIWQQPEPVQHLANNGAQIAVERILGWWRR